jgi:uncharacterized metal-binding protein YceD (DUF177 family)
MPLVCNIRQLAKKSLHWQGELTAAELELTELDECVRVTLPVKLDLDIQLMSKGILAQGKVHLVLDCDCVHCLKRFDTPLDWEAWSCFMPLEGEEPVTVNNDCVDLTPHIREDILLAFPQHPLCEPGCNRLPTAPASKKKSVAGLPPTDAEPSVWAELNKLKL